MTDQPKEDEFNEFDDADFENEVFDEPFDDDGAYLDDSLDDAAFDDADWEEEAFDDGLEGPASEPAKKTKAKKGLSFNTMVIIGGVLVGIVVMGAQLFKAPKDIIPEDAPFISALTPAGQVSNPVTAPVERARMEQAEKESEQTTGFIHNPEALNPTPEAPAAPEEAAQGDVLTPMPKMESAPKLRGPDDAPALQAPEVPDTLDKVANGFDEIQAPADAEEENSAAQFLKQAMDGRGQDVQDAPQDSEQTAELVVPEETAPQQPEVAAPADMQEPALEDETIQSVTDLEKELQDTKMQLANIQEERDSTVQSLQEELESLRTELKETKNDLSAAQSAVKKAEAQAATAAPKVEKAPSTPKTTAPVRKTAAPKPAPTKSWELRAAQPGKAWVSEVGGRGEMRALVVGDTLAGIGEVTSITYNNGIWTVQGTAGKITQ
jgi:chemotaxis protein histidine kinase CheA